jgi:hypothetical protein
MPCGRPKKMKSEIMWKKDLSVLAMREEVG